MNPGIDETLQQSKRTCSSFQSGMDFFPPPLDKLEDCFGGLPLLRVPTPVLFRQFNVFLEEVGVSHVIVNHFLIPGGSPVPLDDAVNENVGLLHPRVWV